MVNLHKTVSKISIGDVQRLIDDGIDINKKIFKKKYTPLHLAAKNGLETIAKLLISNGAVIDFKDYLGFTPLLLATQWNQMEIVKLLLKCHANVNGSNNEIETALHIAVIEGNRDIAELLIANGAKIDAENIDWLNPLHLAVNLFLEKRSNIVNEFCYKLF